jgi:rod shape-determining protein MreD
MRWIRFAVLIIIALILQAGLIDMIAITDARIKPDLTLILLVFFAVYCNTSEAIATSFILGFAADLIGQTMGPQMISFGILGTSLAYLHRVIAIRKMSYQSLAIFAVGFLAGAVTYLLNFLKGQPGSYTLTVVLLAIPLYSAIIGPFLFLPSAWAMRIDTTRFSKQ